MATYLLTWSPTGGHKDQDASLKAFLEGFRAGEETEMEWSIGRKSVELDSDAFLIRLGKENEGLIAYGRLLPLVQKDRHFIPEKAASGLEANYCWLQVEQMVGWEGEERPLNVKTIKHSALRKLQKGIRDGTAVQRSGNILPPKMAMILKAEWDEWTSRSSIQRLPGMPFEPVSRASSPEGAGIRVTVNRRERSRANREAVINGCGGRLACVVCDMTFREVYGDDFGHIIEVHHTVPVSKMPAKYRPNLEAGELVPVCPNCHAAIHSRREAYSIDEMKRLWKARRLKH